MAAVLGMAAGGLAAGTFGSLLGLGGGILIVPLLTLGFDLPLREAVGVSLVSVIMTSGASAGVYLERHVANLRLGMTLELFTAIGALVGGLVAFLLDESVIAGLFTILLVYTAVSMARGDRGAAAPATDDPVDPTDPPPTFTDSLSGPGYRVRHLREHRWERLRWRPRPLLGVGGGPVKCRLPPGWACRCASPQRRATLHRRDGSAARSSTRSTAGSTARRRADGRRHLPRRVARVVVAHRIDTRLLRHLDGRAALHGVLMARRALGLTMALGTIARLLTWGTRRSPGHRNARHAGLTSRRSTRSGRRSTPEPSWGPDGASAGRLPVGRALVVIATPPARVAAALFGYLRIGADDGGRLGRHPRRHRDGRAPGYGQL
jgi:hypothetical protein